MNVMQEAGRVHLESVAIVWQLISSGLCKGQLHSVSVTEG